MSQLRFSAGEIVFHQGDSGDGVYLLLKGIVDAVIKLPGGRQKRVQTLFPGAFFGEMALMDDGERAASIQVVEDAECLKLSKSDYQSLMNQSPQVAFKVLNNIGGAFQTLAGG